MGRRLTEALDDTLASLACGESQETCLASYPESAHELIPLIDTRQQLEVLRNVPPLSASDVALRRSQFLSAARAIARQPEPARRFQRVMGWILPSSGQERSVWIPALVRVAVILLTVLGTLGGAAAMAQSSLPGSPVYGLKLVIEDARLSLTADPSQRVILNLAFTAERTREIQRVAVTDRTISPKVQQRLNANLDAALQSADAASDDVAPRLLEQIRMTVQVQERSLAQAQLHAPEGAQMPLQLAQQAMARARVQAEQALSDPSRLRYRHRLGTPGESAATPTGKPQTPTPTRQTTATPQPTWTPPATITTIGTVTPQITVTPELTLTPQYNGAEPRQLPTRTAGPQATVEPKQTEPNAQPTSGQDEPTSQPSRHSGDGEGSASSSGQDSGGATRDGGSGTSSGDQDPGGATGDGGSGSTSDGQDPGGATGNGDSGSDSQESGGGRRRP